MKRSGILRRSPLHRGQRLASRPQPVDRTPERKAWAFIGAGVCECCNELVPHLEGHHVVPRSLLFRENRSDLAWDQRNRMLLCPACHARHTSHFRLIPVELIPEEALAFAVDFFGGDERAADFIRREYGCGRGTGL